ncbi:hypothetical protein SK128_001919 [Halocaridina rubra]|uniref:Uncharacterized protein n=1 Tax=Halocaridina rubra TaxID=373956 RepID=A0AAN8XQY5_HALRR
MAPTEDYIDKGKQTIEAIIPFPRAQNTNTSHIEQLLTPDVYLLPFPFIVMRFKGTDPPTARCTVSFEEQCGLHYTFHLLLLT